MALGASGVRWTAYDFAYMAMLVAALGLGLELALRLGSWARRLGAAALVAVAALVVWIDGAVGLF
ncbi:hypothetical protein SAMN05444417_3116 [Wenxinia saemankumensis]|uniref:Uncharacterized protein n=2 Tax=Wenxinia saemankumensis TaxID=1447782 RepID=A0A1M6HA57_9RHOB|nr:hypothetical protein SAMN05444417_3116 [Wenxinia saemankumensis]